MILLFPYKLWNVRKNLESFLRFWKVLWYFGNVASRKTDYFSIFFHAFDDFVMCSCSQLSVLSALLQLLIERFRCQCQWMKVCIVRQAQWFSHAQGSREIFQPEKFLDRNMNRTHRLGHGGTAQLSTRLWCLNWKIDCIIRNFTELLRCRLNFTNSWSFVGNAISFGRLFECSGNSIIIWDFSELLENSQNFYENCLIPVKCVWSLPNLSLSSDDRKFCSCYSVIDRNQRNRT